MHVEIFHKILCKFSCKILQNSFENTSATTANFAVQYCVITAKFGGTAVTPENLHFVKNILSPNHKVVVVSAIGKRHFGDTKTTDLLHQYFALGNEKCWQKVCQNYQDLVEQNGIDLDVDKYLFIAKKQAKISLAHCLSLGEELSARCVAKYLGGQFLDAQNLVIFKGNRLDLPSTISAIKGQICGNNLVVVGGFYGGNKQGRQVFPRGGGDISGAIFARATGSSEYQNWTDVDGVCTVDPTLASGGFVYPNLSYNQMHTMANCGANVLHKTAVKLCQSVALPICVGNFFSGKIGTVVGNVASKRLLSVTEKKCKNQVVSTVIHKFPMEQIAKVVAIFCKQFAKLQRGFSPDLARQNAIHNVEICKDSVVFRSACSLLPLLWHCFQPLAEQAFLP